MERKEIVETLRSMANIYKMGGDMYGAKAQAEAVEVLEAAANMLDNDEICKSLSGLIFRRFFQWIFQEPGNQHKGWCNIGAGEGRAAV